jgi:hypothetical protein
MGKICMRALCLSLGITWGLAMLILGWVAAFGWGTTMVHVFSSLYIGYSPTFWGGIIGGIWAFFDAAVLGIIISFFYNLFICKANPCECKKEECECKKEEENK